MTYADWASLAGHLHHQNRIDPTCVARKCLAIYGHVEEGVGRADDYKIRGTAPNIKADELLQRDRCRIDVVIASQSCDNRGMARISITYLLLIAIVACPFNCMGFFDHSRSVGETVKSCACCMERQALEPSGDCSNEGDREDDRPSSGHSSCICDGAMLSQLDSADIELSDSSLNWDFLVYCFADPRIVAVQKNWIFEEQTRPFIVSGSFVRISHRSLLI